MSEIVEFVRATAIAVPKMLYITGLILLALYFADRGRKAARIEQSEESNERRAA